MTSLALLVAHSDLTGRVLFQAQAGLVLLIGWGPVLVENSALATYQPAGKDTLTSNLVIGMLCSNC